MQQFFAKNYLRFYNPFGKVVLSLCTIWFTTNSAFASTVIEQAEIYKIRNQVDINRGTQPDWNKAEPGEFIVPQDTVRTGANSRAEILFNEGTLVRTGAGTTFRFPPGKRSFELTSGAALIMIRPEQGQSTIVTPEAKVVSQGTALFVQHNPESSSSLVGVLTNSPAGLVKVSSINGDVTLQLQAGEFVSIVNGVVGLVEHFVLPIFYETVELSAGLVMKPEEMKVAIAQESAEVQTTIRAIQAEAVEPLQNQLAWLQNFCQIGVETNNLTPLLQLLGISTSGVKVNLEASENLAVIPFRSLDGVTWLGKYCQENSIPGFEPDK